MISTGTVGQSCHGFGRHPHGGSRHGRVGPLARWRFWCSDWVAGEVLSVAVDGADVGKSTVVTRSTSFPFCFDWTGDDELLVTGRRGLERLGPDGRLVPHADLSQLSEYGWNEIVVHPTGAIYINGINFDMMGADGMNFELGSKRGLIAVVTSDGGTRIVADTVAFPNGMAITPNGATLLVAESFASRVAAFDVADDYSLTNRRVWAEIDGGADGVSLDAEGALWCATQGGATRLAVGRPGSPTHRARPSGLLRCPWRTKQDDAVHGRQRMERLGEHRQGSSHRDHLRDRG